MNLLCTITLEPPGCMICKLICIIPSCFRTFPMILWFCLGPCEQPCWSVNKVLLESTQLVDLLHGVRSGIACSFVHCPNSPLLDKITRLQSHSQLTWLECSSRSFSLLTRRSDSVAPWEKSLSMMGRAYKFSDQ